VAAVADNRARIEGLERELTRTRDRLHRLEGSIQGLSISLVALRELPQAVDELRGALERLSRRAIERPQVPTLQMVAAWLSLIVAVTALVVVTFHRP
jgi:chromosome segregation ATPase